MTVKEVLLKYNAIVPFPWTIRKISAAGFVSQDLFHELGEELSKCVDVGPADVQEVVTSINELNVTQ